MWPVGGDVVNEPLLVLAGVVDAGRQRGGVVDHVQLVAAVRPRNEHDDVSTVQRKKIDGSVPL